MLKRKKHQDEKEEGFLQKVANLMTYCRFFVKKMDS